jgi:adenine-specific DNA-methyltransferase
MKLKEQLPSQALDLAYRRQKITTAQLDAFRTARVELLKELPTLKGEDGLPESIRRFLSSVGFDSSKNYIHSEQPRDLIMRNGPKSTDSIGVLLELKHTKNPGEMVTVGDLNRKALHELVLYYLEDRVSGKGDDLRRLVITDGYRWFLFDALDFDRVFQRNTPIKQLFRDFKDKRKASKTNDYFYSRLKAIIPTLAEELPYTYVDLTAEPGEARALGWLTKLFSPPHLLKEAFAADANTLNQGFYVELLYLLGLEEVKSTKGRLIQRCSLKNRQLGSLMENTIMQLEAEDGLTNLTVEERELYGDSEEEQLEATALELCLTWINRFLFLKLLEGQLRRYHPDNREDFRFMSPQQLPEYDHVNKLFFRVLNRPVVRRHDSVRGQYDRVPYLNSSLFENSFLERRLLRISNLDDHIVLPLHPRSVLRESYGTKGGVAPQALPYLLDFFNAYDFASDGNAEEVGAADDNRQLISAAVLGLIFEKINGYKEGSVYTPGFVTMYMCRETLRKAVLDHFEKRHGYFAGNIAELADRLDYKQRADDSAYFNQIRVCDPAVGSGHFLVSALNELLAIKSELRLLLDDSSDHKRLRYRLTVARDELVVQQEDSDDLVQYTAKLGVGGKRTVPAEHDRLQRTLFREKRALMEHCLFGVDVNPNSVRICRLRLWIELLKHAYYRPDTDFQELETLPNLDLNIRVGNSLLGRFPLHEDLSEVFKNFSMQAYRDTVTAYFSAQGRQAKQELQDALGQLRQQITTEIHKRDPLRKQISKLQNEQIALEHQQFIISENPKQKEARMVEVRRLELYLTKLRAELTEREQGLLYRAAFEWRFEFPEVLDDAGAYRGFDVVLGNPPYIRQGELETRFKQHLASSYQTNEGKADLYVYFIEQGMRLLRPGGLLTFIVKNKWLRASYGKPLRHLLSKRNILNLIDFGDLPVFPEAIAYPLIMEVQNIQVEEDYDVRVAEVVRLPTPDDFRVEVNAALRPLSSRYLNPIRSRWLLAPSQEQDLLDRLDSAGGSTLGNAVGDKIFRGIVTGLNEAFVIPADVRAQLIADDSRSEEVIRIFAEGEDLKYYQPVPQEQFLIVLKKGWTRLELGWKQDHKGKWQKPAKENHSSPWEALEVNYPAIAAHLKPFQAKAEKRGDKGDYWWELRACDYYPAFEKPKILLPDITPVPTFLPDTQATYLTNSAYFIASDSMFLVGVLNSRVARFYFNHTLAKVRGDYLRFFAQDLSPFPLPFATVAQQEPIVEYVRDIVAARTGDAAADLSELEGRIDLLVADLYKLTQPEKDMVGIGDHKVI